MTALIAACGFAVASAAILGYVVIRLSERLEEAHKATERIFDRMHEQYVQLLELAKAPNAEWYASRHEPPEISQTAAMAEEARRREEEGEDVWDETGLYSVHVPPAIQRREEVG